MPARDYYHDVVRNALEKDGWTITHDPYRLKLTRGKNLFVDLGAERLIAAEKGVKKMGASQICKFPSDWQSGRQVLQAGKPGRQTPRSGNPPGAYALQRTGSAIQTKSLRVLYEKPPSGRLRSRLGRETRHSRCLTACAD